MGTEMVVGSYPKFRNSKLDYVSWLDHRDSGGDLDVDTPSSSCALIFVVLCKFGCNE